MTDPLGQSQVVPYLEGLSRLGHRFVLVSHEKPGATPVPALAERLERASIDWVPLRYHARPRLPATVYDIARMIAEGGVRHLRQRFDLVHCRSYIAGAAGLALRRNLGLPFLFDMRGFWIDERTTSGNLRSPAQERLLRGLERRMVLGADGIVVLTRKGIETMFGWPYVGPEIHPRFQHIPTCVDLAAYAPAFEARRARVASAAEPRTFTYLGAVGLWHSPEDILRFAEVVQRRLPEARFRFLVSVGQDLLRDAIARTSLGDRCSIARVPHTGIPAELADADVGFFFIRPSVAEAARSPTKLGEMLAAEVPVVTGSRIGDVDAIVREGVGAIAETLDAGAMEAGLEALLGLWRAGAVALAERCRRTAEAHFSLARGVAAYDALYRRIARPSTRSG